MRLSMLPLNVTVIHCSLNVTSAMAWTTKGKDSLNRTTTNAKIPLYEFHSSSTPACSPDWCCAEYLQIHFMYHQNTVTKKKTFSWTAFNALKHQHHLAEFYLTMAKKAFEVFQAITCSTGVTYNVNVRYTRSLMLNIVVSYTVYKSFLMKFIQVFIVVVGRWRYFVYTLGNFLNNLLISVLPASWPWANLEVTKMACHLKTWKLKTCWCNWFA